MTDRAPGAPMDLANMRANGGIGIRLLCACGREVAVNVDHLPGHLAVPSIRLRYRCSVCGQRPRWSRPDWSGRGYA